MLLVLLLLLLGPGTCSGADGPLPTCNGGISDDFYFPNDCVSQCQALGVEIDLDESRDVNGITACYCTNGTSVCNDEPSCADLLVIPGAAEGGCTALCPNATLVTVVDDVQFTDDPTAGNKNQTHFMVSCACDGVTQCGIDFVLFSDLTFLPSCSGDAEGPTLDVNSEEECTSYCTSAGSSFTGGSYEEGACTCSTEAGTAVACDDAKANDDRGDFVDCFDEVGVSSADCPTPAPTEAPPVDSSSASDVAMACSLGAVLVSGGMMMTMG